MQRYFIKENQINNNIITIDESDSHHIKDVMRMHIGEEVKCQVEDGLCYLCKIIDLSKKVNLEIIESSINTNELKFNVSIAQGLVKRDKQEEVIRRLVELGAYSYIPVEMDRSVVKAYNKEFSNERLERIVKEASEQSFRAKLLKLNDVFSFKELINTFDNYDLILFCSVKSKDELSLKDKLNITKDVKNILVIVGPEGGFSDQEIELMDKDNRVTTITLGKRVLRTETAPLYAMSVISFLGERDEL